MSLSRAISWRWPGARVVVRGGALERWEGPMAEPTPAELAQALTDYTAAESTIQLDAEVARAIDVDRLASAIIWAVIDTYSAPATPAKYAAARTKIIAAFKARPWL